MIVAMRADLLKALEQHPHLKAVEADLKRLLTLSRSLRPQPGDLFIKETG